MFYSWMQDRPSTKVHSAPGGGSSLGYLFGGGPAGGGGNWDMLAYLQNGSTVYWFLWNL